MQFITASLGVECSYCHVEGHPEKDDKKPKQVARDMMQMMFALNKNNFAGHREVTCYSCHRGAPNPLTIPLVAGESQPTTAPTSAGPAAADANADSAAPKLPANLPTVSQLLKNYVRALGGSAAIEKITTRVEKGSTTFHGQSQTVEIFTQSPDKRSIVRHLPGGENGTTFDGQSGWSSAPGRPPREMHDADIAAARMDADLQFPLHIQQLFPELRLEHPEKIADRDTYLLVANREGQPPVKLYFDEQSGLLVRMIRHAETPLGRNPTQIDYADHRGKDGVQVPFQVTTSQPGNTSAIQFETVQQNIPIDPAKFAKPPAPANAK